MANTQGQTGMPFLRAFGAGRTRCNIRLELRQSVVWAEKPESGEFKSCPVGQGDMY